jgi:methylated-DNA-[protein]-cysteine S-methyltransferase
MKMARGETPASFYSVFDTAMGPCGLAWNADGLTRFQLPERDLAATEKRLMERTGAARAETLPDWIEATIEAVRRYAQGEAADFASVPLDMSRLSDFHRRIYKALSAVPWGQTTTYGDLARTIGEPGASRAIGHAMSRNPFPLIVPCHRVLAKGNRIGGFSAHGGAVTKTKMLALEGLKADADTPLLPGLLSEPQQQKSRRA